MEGLEELVIMLLPSRADKYSMITPKRCSKA